MAGGIWITSCNDAGLFFARHPHRLGCCHNSRFSGDLLWPVLGGPQGYWRFEDVTPNVTNCPEARQLLTLLRSFEVYLYRNITHRDVSIMFTLLGKHLSIVEIISH
jgi:hypothetical protein